MRRRSPLNHVYRTVWNQALGAMVAVAEIERSHIRAGGAASSAPSAPQRWPSWPVLRPFAAAALACWLAQPAWANPSGAVPVVGSATLQAQGNRLTVTTRNGPGLGYSAIDWQRFSIPAGHTTFFQQPNALSTSINRVVTATPSQIFGTLGSNGRLVLVNPAGIAVGAGAVVDTAGFTAAAMRMTDADLLQGRLRFGDAAQWGGQMAGTVSVAGNVLARSGDVFLLGSDVSTAPGALIQAPNGSAVLAAGQQIEITARGLEGIVLHVQAPQDRALNLGILAGNAVGIFAGTLRHSGQITAYTVAQDGGRVVLRALGDAVIDGAGRIDAKGAHGGKVDVLGSRVVLADQATVDASGTHGGGTIRVGGDWQGKNPAVPNAQTTDVGAQAVLRADATQNGNGGTVVVWSDGHTRAFGTISARGGATGGDGGKVETSGKGVLEFRAKIDTSAPQGQVGQVLLDPVHIRIRADLPDIDGNGAVGDDLSDPAQLGTAETYPEADSVITSGAIEALLPDNDVTLSASQDIDIESSIYRAEGGAARTLSMLAGGKITLHPEVTVAGTPGNPLHVTMHAGGAGSSLAGTIDNQGGFTTLAGDYSLAGKLANGTLVAATGSQLALTSLSGSLRHLAIGSDVHIGGEALHIEGGLALAEGIQFDTGGNTVYLWSDQPGSAADVAIHLAEGASAATLAHTGSLVAKGTGVTIGEGVTVQGSGALRADPFEGSRWTNYGLIDNDTGDILRIAVDHFYHYGTLRASSGTIEIDVADAGAASGSVVEVLGGAWLSIAQGWAIDGALHVEDSATLSVQAGTLALRGSFTHMGTVDIAAGATLTKAEGWTNQGILSGAGTIVVGTGDAALRNEGTIAPAGEGNVGSLHVQGDVLLGATSHLQVDVGSQEEPRSDVLDVAGDVTLAGTVAVSLMPGYVPQNTDAFPMLAATGASIGTFDASTVLSGFEVGYGLYTGEAARLIYPIDGSAVVFTNASGGLNWATPGNWSTGQLPGEQDAAYIYSGLAVTHSSGTDTIAALAIANGNSLKVSGGALTVTGSTSLGGTLTVTAGTATLQGPVHGGTTGAIALQGGTLNVEGASSIHSYTQSGGTLAGAGALQVNGAFSWSSGTMTGTGHTTVAATVDNGVVLTSPYGVTQPVLTRTLHNLGTIHHEKEYYASSLTINEGGVLDNQGEYWFVADTGIAGTGGVIRNTGLLGKKGGTGDSVLTAELQSDGGSFVVDTGKIRAAAGFSHTGAGTLDGHLAISGGSGVASGKLNGMGTLEVASNATLTMGASGLEVPTYKQTGGTLNGEGNLTATTGFYWSSGTMDGTGRTIVAEDVDAGIILTSEYGVAQPVLTRTLQNLGTIVHKGAYYNGSLVINQGGKLDNQGAYWFDADTSISGAGGEIVNTGIFGKSAGTGVSNVSATITNQGGTIQVDTGKVQGTAGFSHTGSGWLDGHLVIAAGSSTATGDLQGSGTLELAGGGLTVGAEGFDVPGYRQTGGTLDGAGDLSAYAGFFWSSGTMTGAGKTIVRDTVIDGHIQTSPYSTLQPVLSRTLQNWGTIHHDKEYYASSLVINDNGVLDNRGYYFFTADTGISGTGGSIVNTGTFGKSGGSGTSSVSAAIQNDGGILQIDSGTIYAAAGFGHSGDGTILTGRLAVTSGSGIATGTLAGTGTLDVAGGTLTVGADGFAVSNYRQTGGRLDGEGDLHATEGFYWSSGTMAGIGKTVVDAPVADGTIHTVEYATTQPVLERTLENYGTIHHEKGYYVGKLTIQNGGVLHNAGTFLFDDDTGFAGTGGSVVNTGTFGKSAGTGTSTVSASVQNTGMIHVASGALGLTAPLTQQGTVQVDASATLSATAFTNEGTMQGMGTVSVGTGQTLVNVGTIAPGTARTTGALAITGNLQLAEGSVLDIDAMGAEVGAYDRLRVTGTVALGGALRVSLPSEHPLVLGDALPILTSTGTSSGTFADTTSLPTQFQVGYRLATGETARLIYSGEPGTVTFTNAADTLDWSTPGNWSTGALPTASETALLSTGVAVAHTAGEHSIAGLRIDADNALNISGGSLTVTEGATVRGTLGVSGTGTATFSGQFDAQQGGVVQVSGGTLRLQQASMASALTVTGGSIVADDSLVVDGSFHQDGGSITAARYFVAKQVEDTIVAGNVLAQQGLVLDAPGLSILGQVRSQSIELHADSPIVLGEGGSVVAGLGSDAGWGALMLTSHSAQAPVRVGTGGLISGTLLSAPGGTGRFQAPVAMIHSPLELDIAADLQLGTEIKLGLLAPRIDIAANVEARYIELHSDTAPTVAAGATVTASGRPEYGEEGTVTFAPFTKNAPLVVTAAEAAKVSLPGGAGSYQAQGVQYQSESALTIEAAPSGMERLSLFAPLVAIQGDVQVQHIGIQADTLTVAEGKTVRATDGSNDAFWGDIGFQMYTQTRALEIGAGGLVDGLALSGLGGGGAFQAAALYFASGSGITMHTAPEGMQAIHLSAPQLHIEDDLRAPIIEFTTDHPVDVTASKTIVAQASEGVGGVESFLRFAPYNYTESLVLGDASWVDVATLSVPGGAGTFQANHMAFVSQGTLTVRAVPTGLGQLTLDAAALQIETPIEATALHLGVSASPLELAYGVHAQTLDIVAPQGLHNVGYLSGIGKIDVGSGEAGMRNDGTLDPGGTGRLGALLIDGDLQLGTGSVLQADLGGTVTAPESDVLQVSGEATLAGTLQTTTMPGTAWNEQSFDLIQAGSAIGGFETLAVPSGVNGAIVGTTYRLTHTGISCTGVCWDGGAGLNTTWENPLNWTGNALPGEGSWVQMGLVAGVEASLSTEQRIQGISTAANNHLRIVEGGSLSLLATDGTSLFEGDLRLQGGQVTASGLLMGTGVLQVDAGTLHVGGTSARWGDLRQTGGSIEGAGSLTVTRSFQHSGGVIAVDGAVQIAQSEGDLDVGSIRAASLALAAPLGQITQHAPLELQGTLEAGARDGIVLDDTGNRFASLRASNTGAGMVSLHSGNNLTVINLANAGGNLAVTSAQGMTLLGDVHATGTLELRAEGGVLRQDSGVVTNAMEPAAQHSIRLRGDSITLQGGVQSSGSIVLEAPGGVNLLGLGSGGWIDDTYFEYQLPFAFTYFGTEYTKAFITTNGLITFDVGTGSYGDSVADLAGMKAIAPAWNDWVLQANAGKDIRIAPSAGNFSVVWDVARYGYPVNASAPAAIFESVLRPDGSIQFHYGDAVNSTFAGDVTIGISNGMGTVLPSALMERADFSLDHLPSTTYTPNGEGGYIETVHAGSEPVSAFGTISGSALLGQGSGQVVSTPAMLDIRAGGAIAAPSQLVAGTLQFAAVGGASFTGDNAFGAIAASSNVGVEGQSDIIIYNRQGTLVHIQGLQNPAGAITVSNIGGLSLSGTVSANGDVSLASQTGAITQSAPVVAGGLSTSSADGATFTHDLNQVRAFQAHNTGSGTIDFANRGLLSVGVIDNEAGAVRVANNGAIDALTLVRAQGSVELSAMGITGGSESAIRTNGGVLHLTATGLQGIALGQVSTTSTGDAGDITLRAEVGSIAIGAIDGRGADSPANRGGNGATVMLDAEGAVTVGSIDTVGGIGGADMEGTRVFPGGHGGEIAITARSQNWDPAASPPAAGAGDVASLLASKVGVVRAMGGAGGVGATETAAWGSSGAVLLDVAGDLVLEGGITAIAGDRGADVALHSGGTLTVAGAVQAQAVDVTAGAFTLAGGDWAQVGTALPRFEVGAFSITGGTFLRALGGAGTVESPYQLADLYGLQGVGTMPDRSFALTQDLDAQATATWNAGAGFQPLGSAQTPFAGAFDGGYHVVRGLHIQRADAADVGMFGATAAGAVIRNLGLVDAAIVGGTHVGALVGVHAGAIAQSYATGAVRVAGVVETGAGEGAGGPSGGGLVGTNTGSIDHSYATVGVATDAQVVTDVLLGGLVGSNTGAIAHSYAAGTTQGGGLVGSDTGTVRASFWAIDAAGTEVSAAGEGLDTPSLHAMASYAAWNDEVPSAIAATAGSAALWRIYEGQTAPLLAGFLRPLTLSDVTLTYDGAVQTGATYDHITAASGRNAGTYAAYSDQQGYDIQGGALTIAPKMLTVTGRLDVADKVYDGTTIAVLRAGTLQVAGFVDGDEVAPKVESATYADKNAGTNKVVTVTGVGLQGNDAGNYVLPADVLPETLTLAGNILPATVTLEDFAVQSKVYDGTTDAVVVDGWFYGVLEGDDVEIAGGVARFENKDAGTGKTVTLGDVMLDGADAENYVVDVETLTTHADITQRTLKLEGFAAASKVYDRTTDAEVTSTGALSGVLEGDAVTVSGGVARFDTKDAGTGKTVTLSDVMLDGADAGNYHIEVGEAGTLTTQADITQRTLKLEGFAAASKVYDRTINAEVTSTGALSGVLEGDAVTVSGGVARFENKDAGTAKVVTLGDVMLDGADAENYLVDTETLTTQADITQRTLKLEGFAAASKVYDRTTDAELASAGALSGVLEGDAVTVSGGVARFENKDAGTGKTVTLSDVMLDGADAGNYHIEVGEAGTLTTQADITQRTLKLEGFAAASKVYDRTTDAEVTSAGALSGVLQGDAVTVSGGVARFESKDAGTAKTVTLSDVMLDGADAGNYLVDTETLTTHADITQRTLKLEGFAAASKVYDRTTDAELASAGALSGVLEGDVVTVSGGVARFDTKDVGTAKTVTLRDVMLDGADAGNYLVDTETLTTQADITQRTLTLEGFAAASKVYDRTSDAEVTSAGALSGVLEGDAVTVSGGVARFENKDAGTAKAVTLSDVMLDGADAGNYHIEAGTLTTHADITPRTVKLEGFVAASKVYDRTTDAEVTSAGALSGVIEGDVVTVSGGVARFENKDAGTAKVVTLSDVMLDGADAENYHIEAGTLTTQADITQRTLKLEGFAAASKVYDRTTDAELASAGALSGVLEGDAVTVSGGVARFENKDAGTAKVVTLGDVMLDGADAENYQIEAGTLTTHADITQRTLKLEGFAAVSKVYDRTTDAEVTSAGALSGVLEGDAVTVSGGVARFDTKDAGTGKTVTLSDVMLDGADAGNYHIEVGEAGTLTTQADITQRTLKLEGFAAASKVYDRTTDAEVTSAGALSGVLEGDAVTVSGGVARFETKDAGTAKTVTLSDIMLDGADAGNYQVEAGTLTTHADITQRTLKLEGFAAASKVYDRTTDAEVTSAGALSGVLEGDTVSVSSGTAYFDTKDAGKSKTVTLTNFALEGDDASNYVLEGTPSALADITPRTVALEGFAAASKVYDRTTAAEVTTTGTLQGVIEGDAVAISGGVAHFDTKDVGASKTVTFTGLALAGEDASNYVLEGTPTALADITPRTVTLAGFAVANKVYDRSAAAHITNTGALSGVLEGDEVAFAYDGAEFESKDAGQGKVVTLTGLALTQPDAANYVLAEEPVTTTANIDKATLVLTGGLVAQSKDYDGSTQAAIAAEQPDINGLLGGDDVGILAVVGNFLDKNAGQGKPVSLTTVELAGADATNYEVDYSAVTLTADITPRDTAVWTGTGNGSWNDPTQWEGEVLPDGANVREVVIPVGATVIFDGSTTATSLESIDSQGTLLLQGGNLTVAQSLATADYRQTGGVLMGNASVTITGDFVQQGGSIDVEGDVAIRQLLGDLSVGDIQAHAITLQAPSGQYVQSGALVAEGAIVIEQARGNLTVGAVQGQSLTLRAPQGGIAQSGAVAITGRVSTTSADGVTLTHAGNQLRSFDAVVTGAGDIMLTSQGIVELGTVRTQRGDIVVKNTGGVRTGDEEVQARAGSVQIVANSPLTIGTGGLQASGDITLTATNTTSAGDIRINGPVRSLLGSVVLDAAASYTQNSAVSAASAVRVSAQGAMTFGPLAMTDAKLVSYVQAGVVVTPPPSQQASVITPAVEQAQAETVTFTDHFRDVLDMQVFQPMAPLAVLTEQLAMLAAEDFAMGRAMPELAEGFDPLLGPPLGPDDPRQPGEERPVMQGDGEPALQDEERALHDAQPDEAPPSGPAKPKKDKSIIVVEGATCTR
ncbi:YDG domain-containing protein [Candidatus Symbiobacter mobilis]|uniref:Exoprotein n=1 Tax=Candidatus Symbiobacter mobilis CR TaxID=946483 RepID=U5N7W1_9BURK|nr:YDG domain-containing protein [Candidatus Symbiobacter mobilis]AGX86338.1 exoprotein [Candidatus Symbiobacter mobilis CR]